jgi:hypothetical protein
MGRLYPDEPRDMSGRDWSRAVHLPDISKRDHRLCRGMLESRGPY